MSRVFISILYAIATVLATPAAGSAGRPLHTAIVEPSPVVTGSTASTTLERMRRNAGADYVNLWVKWSWLAPTPPNGNHADPRSYNDWRWKELDRQVTLARRHGLEPIVTIRFAPLWAQGDPASPRGNVRPDPVELGLFARAAATRYSGDFRVRPGDAPLPRVRNWSVWNEPNLSFFLTPQFVGTKPFSPGWYRRMLNAFAAGVHAVRSGNVVIAGNTAAFGQAEGPSTVRDLQRQAPLAFMRRLLCLSRSLTPTCADRAHFDVWAHHPYTSGGPTHHASTRDSVSLGDLPAMRRVLVAGVRSGHVVSPRRPVQFWVSEFSWDTKGPDPKGVPLRLHARWVAEALYRMWKAGVTLVTWFKIRDGAFPETAYQSGFYFNGRPTTDDDSLDISRDTPKPSLRAFRFPFVAFQRTTGVATWGRTPRGVPGRVVVERRTRAGWKRVGAVTTNDHGVFAKRFAGAMTGRLRARFGRSKSVAFLLKRPPDLKVFPFGCGGGLPC
ncbi:MAG: hypothetical protein M3312_11060 [Actinomycetota bacterium]|nr:hypothetical protein [Actinomycetota bacterium]